MICWFTAQLLFLHFGKCILFCSVQCVFVIFMLYFTCLHTQGAQSIEFQSLAPTSKIMTYLNFSRVNVGNTQVKHTFFFTGFQEI